MERRTQQRAALAQAPKQSAAGSQAPAQPLAAPLPGTGTSKKAMAAQATSNTTTVALNQNGQTWPEASKSEMQSSTTRHQHSNHLNDPEYFSAARSAAAALASKRLHRQSSGERPRRPARERLAVLHRAMSVAMRPLRRLACLAYGASHKASC